MRKFTILFISILFMSTAIFAGINEDLIQASKKGNISKVKELVRSGAKINYSSRNRRDKKNTALLAAINNKHVDIARFLIQKGANVNQGNKAGMTPLMIASIKGPLPLVKLLVSKGAKIHARDKYPRWNPIIWASDNNQTEIVRFLISKGVKGRRIRIAGKRGDTALKNGARKGNLAIVKMLIANGARVNFQDNYGGWSALLLAVNSSNKNRAALVQFLIDKGAKVNARSKYYKFTPLMQACNHSNLAVVKILVNNGAKLELKDTQPGKGYTALLYAARLYSGLDTVKFLVKKGANKNAKSSKGKTALQITKNEATKSFLRSGDSNSSPDGPRW